MQEARVTISSLDVTSISLILEKVEDKKACRAVCKFWQSLVDTIVKGITYEQNDKEKQIDRCISNLQKLHKWPHLSEVGLHFCRSFRASNDADTIISALLVSAKNTALKELKISELILTAKSAKVFAESLLSTQLELLDFHQCGFRQGTLKAFASMKEWNLRVLRMRECRFEDSSIRRHRAEDVEDYQDGCTYFAVYMAMLFSKCPRLEIFELDCQHLNCFEQGLYFGIDDLEAIMNVKHPVLEEVSFTNCELECQVGELVANKTAVNWPSLRVLNLQGSHIMNDGLIALSRAELPNLEEIDISWVSAQDGVSICEYEYSETAILALQSALDTKWPRLKKLSADYDVYDQNCAILLGGYVPYINLQEIIPTNTQSPQAISAFAKAAKEGRLPAYRKHSLQVEDENAENIAELLASPWPGLEILELYAMSGVKSIAAHEALFSVGISKGCYPSLKELNLIGSFSSDFVLEILKKTWLKLEKLKLEPFLVEEEVNAFLEARLEHFPNLKEIDFVYFDRNLPRKHLMKIGDAYWPKLETIRCKLSKADAKEVGYEHREKIVSYDYKTKIFKGLPLSYPREQQPSFETS